MKEFKRKFEVNKDGSHRVELRTRIGQADFLAVVGLDGYDYSSDKKDGRFSSTRGRQVRISMNSAANLTIDDFNEFLDSLGDEVEAVYTLLKEKDVLDLRYEYDGNTYELPSGLVKQQGLNQEQINAVKALQINRSNIIKAMKALNPKDHKNALMVLHNDWFVNESKLQQAWGFEVDSTKQRWFDVPHCKCPKMDNEERLGTAYAIYVADCPIHGGEIS